MTREQIEAAALSVCKAYDKKFHHKEGLLVLQFNIEIALRKQVNAALEEAAEFSEKRYDLDWEDWPSMIRALKIK